jgi:hypothetical protein
MIRSKLWPPTSGYSCPKCVRSKLLWNYLIYFTLSVPLIPLRCRGCFFILIILQTVGLLGRVISPSQGLYPNTGQHKHRINTHTYQTFMPCVGFEPTIPAPERVKVVHALDRWATMTGLFWNSSTEIHTFATRKLQSLRELTHSTDSKGLLHIIIHSIKYWANYQ